MEHILCRRNKSINEMMRIFFFTGLLRVLYFASIIKHGKEGTTKNERHVTNMTIWEICEILEIKKYERYIFIFSINHYMIGNDETNFSSAWLLSYFWVPFIIPKSNLLQGVLVWIILWKSFNIRNQQYKAMTLQSYYWNLNIIICYIKIL